MIGIDNDIAIIYIEELKIKTAMGPVIFIDI